MILLSIMNARFALGEHFTVDGFAAMLHTLRVLMLSFHRPAGQSNISALLCSPIQNSSASPL